MTAFRHISAEYGCDISLPTMVEDVDCTHFDQKYSEVCSLIIFPWRADKPTDWTDPDDWIGLIDNTNTNDTKAKQIVGIGSLIEVSTEELSLANGRRRITRERTLELRLRVLNMANGHIVFARKLQQGFLNFDCYIETVGGRLIGESEGLRPFFVDAKLPFNEGVTSTEYIELILVFKALEFPSLVNVTGLLPTTESTMNYYQAYSNQVSNSMTFTGSSGALPSNTEASVFLYQNGRKLVENIHYTLTQNPSDVEITVDSNIHVSGSNYEFIINN